jgi:hypothetical protein
MVEFIGKGIWSNSKTKEYGRIYRQRTVVEFKDKEKLFKLIERKTADLWIKIVPPPNCVASLKEQRLEGIK